MRVLVYPHDLEMGGSQLNAIELAGAVRDRGHEVVVYGRSGALNARIEALGLEFIESPVPRVRPTPSVVRHLAGVIAHRGVDVVHGYEWPPILEARLATARAGRGRPVGTVMSMAVAPFIPSSVPLTVGTAQIEASERRTGREDVTVLEPPVDLLFNSLSALSDSADGFRVDHGISGTATLVAMVTRFSQELKLEGLLVAIKVVPTLGDDVVLAVVGDGPERDRVSAAATEANHVAGRRAVLLTGQLEDPRPAYATADVVLGMGGSALRAMAFGVPVVVQGEHGFWRQLSAQTLEHFRWVGWYGVGSGAAAGEVTLRRELEPLVMSAEARVVSGQFARQVVEAHSLDATAEALIRRYSSCIDAPAPSVWSAGDVRASLGWARHTVARQLAGRRGRQVRDDFNGRPVAGTVVPR